MQYQTNFITSVLKKKLLNGVIFVILLPLVNKIPKNCDNRTHKSCEILHENYAIFLVMFERNECVYPMSKILKILFLETFSWF